MSHVTRTPVHSLDRSAQPEPESGGNALALAIFCLGVLALTTLLSLFRQLLGGFQGWAGSVSVYPLAVIISIALGLRQQSWVGRSAPRLRLVLIMLGYAVLLPALAMLLGDFSYDGPTYHQSGVLHFVNGASLYVREFTSGNPWVNMYAKGAWIFAAELVRLTGDIQAGTAHHLFAMLAVLSYALHALNGLVASDRMRWVAALVLAFNPVALAQVWSALVDGYGAAMMTLVVLASLRLICAGRSTDRAVWIVASVLALGVKAPTLIVPAIAAACLLTHAALVRRDFRLLGHRIADVALAVLLLISTVGFQPYAGNLLAGRHVLHPFMGDQSLSFPRQYYPVGYERLSNGARLLHSVFSQSRDLTGHAGEPPPQLKWPGTLTRAQVASFGGENVTVAGWGPWFSLAVALGLLVLALHRLRFAGLFLLGFAILTASAHPLGWWARLNPLLILVPVGMLLAAGPARPGVVRYALLARYALAGALLGNMAMVGVARCIGVSLNERELRAAIAEIGNRVPEVRGHEDLTLIAPALQRHGIRHFRSVDRATFERERDQFKPLPGVGSYRIAR